MSVLSKAHPIEVSDLSPEVTEHYIDIRRLEDGRIVGTKRLLYHWTLHIDIDHFGYAERYCFRTYELVKNAFDTWSGEGDPVGWHRHPESGRRADPVTGIEWNDP